MKPGDAVNMLLAQIEITEGLPFEVSTKGHLLSAEEQGEAWTNALGKY